MGNHGHLLFDGTGSDYAEKTVTGPGTGVTTVDLRALVSFDDWSRAADEMALGTNGVKLVLGHKSGSGLLYGGVRRTDAMTWVTSTAAVTGTTLWIRLVQDCSTGIATFYTSTETNVHEHDKVQTWTQLGDTVDTSNTNGPDGLVTSLVLGQGNNSANRPMDGKLYAGAYIWDSTTYAFTMMDEQDTTWTLNGGVSYVAPVAWSFTPTTHKGSIVQGRQRHNIWRYMNWRDVGYNVIITGGVANTTPGSIAPESDTIAAADSGSGEGGKAWFRGGITYSVNGSENTILTTGGYTVT